MDVTKIIKATAVWGRTSTAAWINFPIPALDFDGRAIVNYYGATYDGYIKLFLTSNGVQLADAYNGTTRVANPIWKVYYR